jgi:hypothetical protein
MNELKHTPGPWVVVHEDCVYVDSPNFLICTVQDIDQVRGSDYRWTFGEVSSANARLIAAAPELLEFLTLALPYVEEGEDFNAPHKRSLSARIRAAITKATRESA